jgi:RNA polymerase sigma-70 factor (ECF subfamily)
MTEKIARLESRPTDAMLVAAACEGDMRAKEAIFYRYAAMASGLAYRLLGRDTDLEDVVQESFTVAFASLEKLAKPQAFAAWFTAIVTGTAVSVIRRRRFLARLGLARQEPIALDTLIAPTAPQEIAAELRAVYGAIDALPTSERVVLLLRRVEHLPLEEIAERTGWSLATVKRRLARATSLLERASGRGEDIR